MFTIIRWFAFGAAEVYVGDLRRQGILMHCTQILRFASCSPRIMQMLRAPATRNKGCSALLLDPSVHGASSTVANQSQLEGGTAVPGLL
jgi:hypothetical protein